MINRNIATMTMPMTTYGVMRMPRSDCFIASNSASDRVARAAESIGFRRAWMKFIATYMPHSEPMGLNDCAKFSRRVAVAGSPIARMYGFALVSRKLRPQVRMKYAIRKGQYDPVDRAAMNRNAPVAYRPRPIRMPLL